MELQESHNGKPQLILTTPEEIEVVSLITNYDWAKYPSILHPIKRSTHRNLARRAFNANHWKDSIELPLSLTDQETAIIAEGVFNLEDELLHLDARVSYTTNTLSRDAAALSIARELRMFNQEK